jgi:hypothetical protein
VQESQQLDLRSRRQVADLVEEDRAGGGAGDQALPWVVGPGEGAPGVAEERVQDLDELVPTRYVTFTDPIELREPLLEFLGGCASSRVNDQHEVRESRLAARRDLELVRT